MSENASGPDVDDITVSASSRGELVTRKDWRERRKSVSTKCSSSTDALARIDREC